MKYKMFLDESGDHNLANYNPTFPIFTLCGVILSEDNYERLRQRMNIIKREFWGDKKIVFHSRDIRKLQRGFEVFFDLNKKQKFYEMVNAMIVEEEYTVISCSIQKKKFIKEFGRTADVYGQSLTYIIERAVFYLDAECKRHEESIDLEVFVEKRGKREDGSLLRYYNEILDRGTYFVAPDRIKAYFKRFDFSPKRDNINGLQLADLIAYPISRYNLDPQAVNLNFDLIKPKFYQKNGKLYGMKVFPK